MQNEFHFLVQHVRASRVLLARAQDMRTRTLRTPGRG